MPQESTARTSVICVFLDGERFIEEALESVFAQSYSDWELILVDDGSADGSTGIAKSYVARHPERVRYFEHPGHGNYGISASRELGIRQARGEFVAFIDSDDVWRQDKLAIQVAAMDRYPECGMVCGKVNYWESWRGGQDTHLQTGNVAETLLEPAEALLTIYPIGTAPGAGPSEVLIRRSILEETGGFDTPFRDVFEDQACFVKIYCKAPVYICGDVLVDYRQHEESVTVQFERDNRTIAGNREFYQWLRDYFIARDVPAKASALRHIRKELRWLSSSVLWKLRRKWRVWKAHGA